MSKDFPDFPDPTGPLADAPITDRPRMLHYLAVFCLVILAAFAAFRFVAHLVDQAEAARAGERAALAAQRKAERELRALGTCSTPPRAGDRMVIVVRNSDGRLITSCNAVTNPLEPERMAP
jgi:hypothetical protein